LTNPNAVTLTVTDVNGNVSTATANVTVVDLVAPVIKCATGSPFTRLVDPYQIYYTVIGTEFDASATDACGIASLTYVLTGATTGSGTVLSNVPLKVGTNTIVWTAVDVNGNSSYCTTVVTVKKRETTLTYNGEDTPQYSDQVTLSAKLVDVVSNSGVSGKTITFTIGSQSETAITNTSGVASALLIITQAPGSYNVVTSFSEDGSYLASSDNDKFTITREDARVEFTGTSIVATASATSGAATVTLRATIQDITAVTGDPAYDAFAGDIQNAKVRFLTGGKPITASEITDDEGWMSPTLISSSNLKTGVVSLEWPVNIGTDSYLDYTVYIEVEGYYINPVDFTVVSVYKATGDFITGGGYIIPTSTAGVYSSDPNMNLKCNFGFNVKYNKKGTNLQGNMNFIIRNMVDGVIHKYQIKANAMTSLGVDISNKNDQGLKAVFVSKANLTDITNPVTPVSLGGNLSLQVSMTDKGEPGVEDAIAISLWNGSTLLYSSNWTGTKTAEMLLGGGNLVVHSSFSVGSMTVKSTDEEAVFVPQAEPGLKVYPNPFKDHLYFDLRIPTDSRVRLEIFDLTGAIIATVFDNNVIADESYFIEYIPENIMNGVFMYRLIIDGKIMYTGKVIRQDH
jgi:hypothetical protein